MKFIPILFSTPMVQALQAGTKTQTRRVVKPQPKIIHEMHHDASLTTERIFRTGDQRIHCPYRQPGDVLWVRETWANTTNVNSQKPWPNRPHIVSDSINEDVFSAYIFRADGEWNWCDDDGFSTDKSHWKPSIFMHKAACRLFLKIKSVRVERLQDISEADAVAEGIEVMTRLNGTDALYKSYLTGSTTTIAEQSYETLWQSINGPESWEANPWVWVVEFEKIEKPENFV